MDSGHGKKRRRTRKKIAVDVDRLSSLPNDLIHKILSFISIKETVRTIAWSSRYRFIWTTMPYLNFSAFDFPTLPKFSKFVTQFLKRRDSRIDVSSLKLLFYGKVKPPYVKKLINYAGLTTLKIRGVSFCSDDHTDNFAGLLSKCANLKNLNLDNIDAEGLSSFSICHPGLANLTIEEGCFLGVKVVNVVAPQLKNLTIGSYDSRTTEYVISAPNLASLTCRGYSPLRLSTDGFHCLKEADIHGSHPNDTDAPQMVCLLQQLYNVKFLTLSLEIIEFLSSSMEIISHQPSPFVNLKSLTVYPREMWRLPKGKVNLSTEVKSYLLDSSPGATFTMFSREEITAVKDIPSTRKLMAELRVLLEQEKANTETKGKAPMESDNAKMHKAQPEMKMQLQIWGNRELIMSYWEDLSVQFEQRKAKAYLIISMLERIEGLLKKLPATNHAMIQPCFSRLCAEADTVMSKLMKMQCDENQSRLSVRFHELATSTTTEPSS